MEDDLASGGYVMRSAERVFDDDGRQYHIGLAKGEIARRVLLVGDPERVALAESRMDVVLTRRTSREYVTVTGKWRDLDVTVMGTGIGCDNTEIALLEILECERHPTLIRVGSCGGLQPTIEIGDLVITTGAMRLESTSLGFVDEGFPAVAHHEVVLALVSAAERLGVQYHTGITATASGFYGWQARRGLKIAPRFPDLPDRLAAQGVLNFEMEASTLLSLSTLANVRAGCVCVVFANRPRNRFIEPAEKRQAELRALDVGFEALAVLEEMDRACEGRQFHLRK